MVLRIQGTIRSIDQGTVLIDVDGQTLRLPLKEMNPAPTVGDVYIVSIMPEEESKLSTEELARTVLNQLTSNVQNDEKIDKD